MERKIRKFANTILIGACIGVLMLTYGHLEDITAIFTIGLLIFIFSAALAAIGIYRSARLR